MLQQLLMSVWVLFFATHLSAQSSMDSLEVSAVSGFLQTSKNKVNGSNAGGETAVSLGGRVHQFLSEDQQWFGEAMLGITSWSAPAGMEAPDNATSIRLVGGLRQFFTEFSQVVIPFASVYGGYQNIKSGEVGATAQETEISGLYYYGSLGFRFMVAAEAFFELECQLFESALFGTTVTRAGGVKTETTRTDLFVNTTGSVANNLRLALGVKI